MLGYCTLGYPILNNCTLDNDILENGTLGDKMINCLCSVIGDYDCDGNSKNK